MPAGTGVWVVNTPPARTTSTASANVRPDSTSSRMRSSDRNPAWPSLVWNTCGCRPSARSARTPPMPSTISWRRRCSMSPPYSRLVMAAISGVLPSTAVSSRYSVTRPTLTCQTLSLAAVVAHVDRHLHAGGGQRQAVRVEAGKALLLVAVGVEPLAEVALGVQQADRRPAGARDRDAALRWSPARMPRPPRVLRQRLAEAELGREVGDQVERARRPGPGTSVARSSPRASRSAAASVSDDLRVGRRARPIGRR